jgi:hypothetical protein
MSESLENRILAIECIVKSINNNDEITRENNSLFAENDFIELYLDLGLNKEQLIKERFQLQEERNLLIKFKFDSQRKDVLLQEEKNLLINERYNSEKKAILLLEEKNLQREKELKDGNVFFLILFY